LAALIVAWLASGIAAALFWMLCEALTIAPLWPTLAFSLAHPYWRVVTASAHPEPLAMVCVLAAALACVRERPTATVAALTLGVLTRFPAVLVAPAFAWRFIARGRWRAAAASLGVPAVTLALWNSYIRWRIPGLSGFSEAHRTWWEVTVVPPFVAFLGESPRVTPFAYAVAAVGLAMVGLGFARLRTDAWLLLWIGGTMLFHAMLSGNDVWRVVAIGNFPRLTLLAWPAAVLLMAHAATARATRVLFVTATLILCVVGQPFATANLRAAAFIQTALQPSLRIAILRLADERATWPIVR
jgi:hypothetical protein